MIKNSALYHRLWYMKKRKSRKSNIYLRIIAIIIILAFLSIYAGKTLNPYVMTVSELKAKALITTVVNQTVIEQFPETIKYEDVIIVEKDVNGHITSIQTNIVKLNQLSARLAVGIQARLSSIKDEYISVPAGVLFGNSIFEGVGPDLRIRIIPVGNVETDFKSEFSSAGINQTRHRLFLQVKAKVGITMPLLSRQTDVVTCIPLAETVIVGTVPDSYINFNE